MKTTKLASKRVSVVKRRPPALALAPAPRELTEQEKFLRTVDQQDTRTRKEMLLFVMRYAEQVYREKGSGSAGYRGDIRKLRRDMAALEHELATVPHIGGR